jgi:hypothetical protein
MSPPGAIRVENLTVCHERRPAVHHLNGQFAPGSLTATVFRAPPEAGALAQYRAAGIDRVLLEVPYLDRDGILRRLDALAPLLRA